MHARNLQYTPIIYSEGDYMFEPIPQEQWLTAQQVFNDLNATSNKAITYERVVQILRELRDTYAHVKPSPYTKIGRSWLYHPDFVQVADSREKTRGVKPKTQNDNKAE